MRINRRSMLAGIAAVAVLPAAACANSTGGSSRTRGQGIQLTESSGPLRVGVIAPLTGALATVGESMRDGITAQANLINASGGVDGHELELEFKDDESTPEVGVTVTNELVRDGVHVIMGGYASSVTLAVQPITSRAGMLYFVAGSQTTKMFDGVDPNALRINTNSEVAGYSAAHYIADDTNATSVGILWENSAYGQDAVAQFKSELDKIDGVTVAAEEQFEAADTDFRTAIGNVKATSPDVVITFGSQALTGQPILMKQLSGSGIDAALFAGFGTVFPATIELAGAAAEGWRSADIYYPDNAPFTDYPASVAFADEFRRVAKNRTPDRWSVLPAQSLMVWSKVVAQLKTTDAARVADAIKGETFADTILGDVSFTDQGQMVARVQVYEIESGQATPVVPIDVPEEIWHVGSGN